MSEWSRHNLYDLQDLSVDEIELILQMDTDTDRAGPTRL